MLRLAAPLGQPGGCMAVRGWALSAPLYFLVPQPLRPYSVEARGATAGPMAGLAGAVIGHRHLVGILVIFGANRSARGGWGFMKSAGGDLGR
jgi:hypothetical protein